MEFKPESWRVVGSIPDANGLWRIEDATGSLVALASPAALRALFAYPHLLAMSRAAHNASRELAGLERHVRNTRELFDAPEAHFSIEREIQSK